MNFKNFLTVVRFTIQDELHNKSFYIFAALSMVFVFLLKGCFHSNFTANGQQVDPVKVGWYASIVAFNIISSGGVLIGILLAMRLFKRDKEYGMTSTILSKPVKRIEYAFGKVVGIWALAYGLTFVLHLIVYIIMLVNTGGRIPFFLPASLITSINVLFAVSAVMFLSMIMQDVVAALTTLVVCVVSLVSDSIYAVTQNTAVQSMMGNQPAHVSLWRIVWPKLVAVQFFATSMIQKAMETSSAESTSHAPMFGPIHPVLNIGIYCVVILALLYWRFSKEELQ